MSQLFDWLAMGGYSLYVWSAYGLVAMVLALNVIAVRRQKKRTKNFLQQWFKG